MDQEHVLTRIEHDALDIDLMIQKMKQRSMIYQIDSKESLAKKRGLPLDIYHNLPFAQWVAVRDEK